MNYLRFDYFLEFLFDKENLFYTETDLATVAD
jgi:hypothetical protein